ncbi:MAG: sugar phosphate nucleotidyltransferase [Patescibacteria group bacterium]
MKAILLAGGKGTRLLPYTTVIPKPLVPVGDKAVLEILIGRLKKAGVTDITLCVNHLAELIMAYFGDGKKWGVKISYSLEAKPLHTVGPLKLLSGLPEDFLVMNGDLLTDLDFKELFEYHILNKSLLTLATYKRTEKIDLGVIEIDEKKLTATGFREKPEMNFNVSMGVYVLNKKVLDFVPGDTFFGFDDLMHTLLEREQTIKTFPFEGYWLDIGRPDDYERANNDIKKLDL